MVEGSESKKETVRIHLPTRPPSNSAPADSPSPLRPTAMSMPAPMTTHSPKKETAVEMKKAQPLIDLPMVEAPVTKVAITPGPKLTRVDEIPMALCWGLLAASVAILILQIWNYLS